MTVKELIEFLLTSRQNLTAVLNRLERSNFIERVRSAADGRIRRIRLTRHGAKTWTRMLINIRTYYKGALDGFTTGECLMLCRLLRPSEVAARLAVRSQSLLKKCEGELD